MRVHELTVVECRNVLYRARHGRLACARDEQPYVVPFFFYLDPAEDFLYSFSIMGQKVEWMRLNPKVCVEVDEVVDRDNWTVVVAFGRYQELDDSPAHADARLRANELLQFHAAWWLPGGLKPESAHEHRTPLLYRIEIVQLTGRRATPGD
jgi:nitroimidazol reductase NimA-like FMN-containing flavoprotein (pyridoxamine 5'-phosphate oxidase superfamily)